MNPCWVKDPHPDRKAGFRLAAFYAYVIGASDAGQHQDKFVYKLELSTAVVLMQNRNSRIFQGSERARHHRANFSRYGFADYRLDIQGTYPTREYCVQFSETDFAFISRLLEDEGIWYYFDHAEDKHTLVITDRQDFDDLDFGYAVLPFMPDSEENRAIREGSSASSVPAKCVRMKSCCATSTSRTRARTCKPRWKRAASACRTRRWSGTTTLRAMWIPNAARIWRVCARRNAKRRPPAVWREQRRRVDGRQGLLLDFAPGRQPQPPFQTDPLRLCVRARWPRQQQRRPQRDLPFQRLERRRGVPPAARDAQPQMPGIQSATVVGAPNSEVHTDKFARIRVHFHWDRYKTTEEDSSCWIRVVQARGKAGGDRHAARRPKCW